MGHEIYYEAIARLEKEGIPFHHFCSNEQSVAQIFVEGRTVQGDIRIFPPDTYRNVARVYGTDCKFIGEKTVHDVTFTTTEDIVEFAKNLVATDKAMTKLLNIPEVPPAP